jgi:hypothetical protein
MHRGCSLLAKQTVVFANVSSWHYPDLTSDPTPPLLSWMKLT